MWFIEHESLFDGKRVWLKPGSQHLYGRTKGQVGTHVFIDSKTVSRQHMMLKVFDVSEGDGMKLHTRSQIEVTDLSGRSGTVIDGTTKLLNKDGEQQKMLLSGAEHTIKLGLNYPAFSVKWQPVVLTYASKDSKSRSAKLHALDIKTTSDFVYNQTTHVVSQKRNLPKVLQGLVSATYIVSGDFLDAILQASTPKNNTPGEYVPSRLEEDFDTWWPKEKDYIPPIGAEPVPRPDQMLEPDPARSEVFSGLTFIFLDENQFNSLNEPISGGGGKALLFHVRPGETGVNEYVQFAKNAAGQKGRSKAKNGRLPIVTVRLSNYPDGMEEWATEFVSGVDRALNQRSILQNEFLDAIIANDTAALQKPPSEIAPTTYPTAQEARSSVRESTPASQNRAASQGLVDEPPTQAPKVIPRKRLIRRGVTASRFTGFDDYEPPPKLRKLQDMPMEDVEESVPIEESLEESHPGDTMNTQTTLRSRPPAQGSVEVADQMDELFPAAAAMKRSRLATRGPFSSAEPESRTAALKTKTKGEEMLEKLKKAKKKVGKEIDIREVTRQRMEKEEEKRRADEESLREGLQGVDISKIRGVVQVEEMEVRARALRNKGVQVQSERWNDDWNGRKNFKKFKRRGAERVPQTQRVIVTLEEAPQKKGFELDDAFFLEETDKPRSKEDERRLKRRIGPGRDDNSDLEPGFTRRRRNKQFEVINVEDSGPDDEEVEDPFVLRAADCVEETQITEKRTQRGTRKRLPVSVAAGEPSSKRNRVIRRDEDSDAEENGFRFRRRA
ncbi:hypothetical protein CC78DRAFT_6871 [Lojkania enalia]|uniref:FHA domain-containing protein n=1 Tax=Lojkania enalia TaxID=147567 RepID=A0A9P4TQY0_9PLEO|nr:hypothetical protein CC78DRAFT_6871 [Didymosphaeria enalia]